MGCTDKVCTDSALTHLAAFTTHLKNIVPTHYACAYAYACDARMGDPGCRVWVQDQSYVRDHHSSRRKTDFKGALQGFNRGNRKTEHQQKMICGQNLAVFDMFLGCFAFVFLLLLGSHTLHLLREDRQQRQEM